MMGDTFMPGSYDANTLCLCGHYYRAHDQLNETCLVPNCSCMFFEEADDEADIRFDETLGSNPWTHACCDDCWEKMAGDVAPARARPEDGEYVREDCCFCGQETKGIYVEEAPEDMPCGGMWYRHHPEKVPHTD